MKKDPVRSSMLLSATVHLLLLGGFLGLQSQARGVSMPLVIDFSVEKTAVLPETREAPKVRKKQAAKQPVRPQAIDPQEVFPDTVEADTAVAAVSDEDSSRLAKEKTADEDSLNRLKAAYVQANYPAIRDQVYGKLGYPEAAVQHDWQGEVKLSFFVHCDGRVDNIRVLESSGYTLLDENAMEAVRRAAPFSPSPKKVEIRLPVKYRLE